MVCSLFCAFHFGVWIFWSWKDICFANWIKFEWKYTQELAVIQLHSNVTNAIRSKSIVATHCHSSGSAVLFENLSYTIQLFSASNYAYKLMMNNNKNQFHYFVTNWTENQWKTKKKSKNRENVANRLEAKNLLMRSIIISLKSWLKKNIECRETNRFW